MNPDERKWQAQERAAKAERAGNVLLDLDPLSAGYVPIVRALREPMAVGLSDDFAARVARLAARTRTDRMAAVRRCRDRR